MQLLPIFLLPVVAAISWVVLDAAGGGPNLSLPYPVEDPIAPISPSFYPKIMPLKGDFEPNDILQKATRLFKGQIQGSETVAHGQDGSLVMSDRYGNVRQALRYGKEWRLEPKPLVHLGSGRPLGFEFDKDGNLIVCNAGTGLQMVEKDTHMVVLLTGHVPSANLSAPPDRIRYANDLDIAHNSTVYFTDSQKIGPILNKQGYFDTLNAYIAGALQGTPTGRVLAYDPPTRLTRVIATGLWYPNGITLSPAGDYLAVVETSSWRVARVWLTGPKAGTRDILIDTLPGFPDGITRTRDGRGYWISVVLPKHILLKTYRSTYARYIVGWAPTWLRPKPKKIGCVVQVSDEGQVLRVLMDREGVHVSSVSAVVETDSQLFLGNLNGDYVSVLDKSHLPTIL